MIESQQVLEWIAMGETRGEAKGWATALLIVLEARFPLGATAEMATAIHATTNLERLKSWLPIALKTNSLDAFRQAAGL
jgi:hypothetical protein